jgi:hypothetical protein
LKVLFLSNRITFAETLCERAREFDESTAAAYGTARLGFRSYTEKDFKRHKVPHDRDDKAPTGSAEQKRRAMIEYKNLRANRLLVSTPRLIISPQSLPRLFAAKTESGESIVPRYDIVIGDEFMEILHIFHTSTMNDKRRIALEHLQVIMSTAKRNIVMDADLIDAVALPMLHQLTKGAKFTKLHNTAQTLPRTYFDYPTHELWRLKLLAQARCGRKIFVACNTKAEVESIVNDPELIAIVGSLRMKGLHADSTAQDRKDFIQSVQQWNGLHILVISPVISHGVNFDEPHFDDLFIFGSDRSTMPTQLFQQANRCRKIGSNEVHVFLNVHSSRYCHLPCDATSLKVELNEVVREYQSWVCCKHPLTWHGAHACSTCASVRSTTFSHEVA